MKTFKLPTKKKKVNYKYHWTTTTLGISLTAKLYTWFIIKLNSITTSLLTIQKLEIIESLVSTTRISTQQRERENKNTSLERNYRMIVRLISRWGNDTIYTPRNFSNIAVNEKHTIPVRPPNYQMPGLEPSLI